MSFRPVVYLKEKCPFCMKVRILLLESGLQDHVEVKDFAPGADQEKAIRGEFKAWAGEGGSPSLPPASSPPPRPATPAPSSPPPPAPNGPGREAARAYLAKLRSTLGDS